MRVEKRVKLDNDVLLDWIYTDEYYLREDYTIIVDTLRNTRSFSNAPTTGVLPSQTNNISTSQLFSLDPAARKWGIVDITTDNTYKFLQFQNYPGNTPSEYNLLRLYFPINYTFKDKLGFLLNISLYNQSKTKLYSICNYYYDKTDVERGLTEMEFAAPPLQFQQKFYGKFIELYIPSPYALTRDYQTLPNFTTQPRPGSIHKNLVYNDSEQLAIDSPVFIDFQFLTKKETKLLQSYYYVGDTYSTTLPVTPEYSSISVMIQHHQTDDYFQIFGTFNSNTSEFSTFINQSKLDGKNYSVIYEVSTFEKNIKTGTNQFILNDNFDLPIDFRPIIKFSTTTAVLDITMNLVDSNSNSQISRTTSYVLLQDEVSKYSAKLTKINIKNTYNPKIYSAKPDQLIASAGTFNTSTTNTIRVPYPVFYDRVNIVLKNISESVNDTVYYGLGQSEILIQPTDTIFRFVISTGTDSQGYIPFQFDSSFVITLLFKSEKTQVEIPLYYSGGINSDGTTSQVDLSKGVLIFRIQSSQVNTLKNIFNDGFNQYFICSNSDLGQYVVYSGYFRLFNQLN